MTIERPLANLTATEAAIAAEEVRRITADEALRAGWGDPGRFLKFGVVLVVLLTLLLGWVCLVGYASLHGLVQWLPDWLPQILAGIGIGGGVVAGVKK